MAQWKPLRKYGGSTVSVMDFTGGPAYSHWAPISDPDSCVAHMVSSPLNVCVEPAGGVSTALREEAPWLRRPPPRAWAGKKARAADMPSIRGTAIILNVATMDIVYGCGRATPLVLDA
mmetsp:Transcript_99308/g.266736  ORF Transcript_99308/g.266736 Transcript_99308/m.266736 type:complete len:118 (+) Transcript_99308:639-992(+)